MKYIALIGSNRKRNCYKITALLSEMFKEGGVEVEYIFLGQMRLDYCRGCGICVDDAKRCPLNDDFFHIMKKLEEAQGIIISSPVYIYRESGLIKNFFDRAYYLHFKPSFFDKVAIVLSVAGRKGLRDVLDYLELNMLSWGCRVAGRVGVEGMRYYSDDSYRELIFNKLKGSVLNALDLQKEGSLRSPGLLDLQIFNEHKDFVIACEQRYPAAYRYWQERGWLEMDYYFNVDIEPALLEEAKRKTLRAGLNE